ncbi:MAG: SRPBCC domain-containing protein [bacterium]
MQLSGLIKTTCPPDFLVKVLQSPEVLQELIPEQSDLTQTAPGHFSFSFVKSFGRVKLTLPGTLNLEPLGTGSDRHLTAAASHLIGGKVKLQLDLTFTTQGNVTHWNYQGDVTASGLAGRVLRDNQKRVSMVLRTVLFGVKAKAEQMFNNNQTPSAGTTNTAATS